MSGYQPAPARKTSHGGRTDADQRRRVCTTRESTTPIHTLSLSAAQRKDSNLGHRGIAAQRLGANSAPLIYPTPRRISYDEEAVEATVRIACTTHTIQHSWILFDP